MTDIPVSEMPLARHVLHDLGFFGHYLHMNAGGRSGQQHILVALHKHGGSMTQRELQDLCDISSGSLSEVLAKLESAGSIERTRSDEDRRQLVLTLTDEGSTRVEEAIARRQAFEGECLACLNGEEREQLVQLLDRMVEHWQSIERREGCA